MVLTGLRRVFFFKFLRSKWLVLLGVILFSYSVFATNGKTTYQAKIVKPDGYPLEAASVTFKFTVLDTVGACVLYSEMYSAVDMRSTGGLISFALGNGARDFPASGTTAVFANVFDNSIVSMPCQAPGIYNPGPNDTRKIVMQFNDGTGWQTLPAMTINSVPYAMYAGHASNAKALNGKAAADFVEVSTLANLNCGVNQAIKFNNATFTCIDVPASGSGGITSVTTSGSVLVTGGTASAPVISIQAATLSQNGYLTSLDYAEFKAKLSASATQIINTLGFAPVSSSIVASQIASSTLAGDVSGNPGSTVVNSVAGKTAAQISTSVDATLAATASATAETLVKRNISGNATVNDLYANAVKINYVDIYKPTTSFNVRLQAPTSLSANYVLNLPTTSGTTGQVLSTDGDGNLSWINPSTGSVVSVSATAPLASTGGTTPTISISQATSGTDGYLSALDWNTFNNKQQATSAAIITTLGYEPVASGSVVSSQWVSNGSTISYDQGYVGIGLSDPAHALSVSGTAFFSGVATVSGSLTGAVVLPGGNANQNPVIFRFDQNVLAYADKWATVTTTPIFNAQKLFNINDGGVNLYDVNAGADVVIEVTGVSIGNTSNINMWPFVVFHSNPTGNVKLELLNNSLVWETAYEGPTAAYVLKKFSLSAGGLRGARFTFSAMSTGTWLKTVGVIGRNSTPYQWVLRRDGGTVYGDINLIAKLGVGLSSPSARIQIASGSTSMAPLKINSGTLLTSAQAGAIEYDGVNFYLTDNTNTRRSIATVASPGSFDNTTTISNSSGNIALSPNNTTGSVVVSATTASSDANTGALVVKGGAGISGNLNVSGTMATSSIVTSIINGTTDLLLNPNGGNVGVGVSSPTSRLDVGGDINMASNSVLRSGGRQLLLMGLSGTTYLDSNGAGTAIRLQPNGNVAMTLTASGNVGVGTTTPLSKFDVNGVIQARSDDSSIFFQSYNNSASTSDRFNMAHNGFGVSYNSPNVNGVHNFTTNGASRLFIGNTGNIGIGTSSPAARMQVSGTVIVGSQNTSNIGISGFNLFGEGTQIINIASNGNNGTGLRFAGAGDRGGIFADAIYDIRIEPNREYGQGNIILKAKNGTSNVGIGISNPNARLQITSGTSAVAAVKLTSGTLLTTPQAGAVEYDGSQFYVTDGTSTRRSIATVQNAGSFDNTNTISNNSGNITLAPNNSTGSVLVSATTGSTDANTGALVVKGGAGISGNLNVSGAILTSANIQGASITATSGIITPAIYGTSNLAINPSGGNVGIGTNNPTRKLHLHESSGGPSYLQITASSTGVGIMDGFQLAIDGSTSEAGIIQRENSLLYFSTNNIPRLNITGNGNVGIGTTSPDQNLVVSGVIKSIVNSTTSYDPSNMSISPGEADGLIIHNNGSSSNSTYAGLIFRNKASNVGVGRIALTGGSATSALTFSLRPSTGSVSASEVMRINSAGNVGIGTSDPNTKLHISGSSPVLQLESSTTNSYLRFNTTSTAQAMIGSENGRLKFQPNDTVGESLTILPTGLVGIGTVAPGYKLQVSGTASVNDKLWASYGNQVMNGYSWVNAAFTTNSIEIVNNNGADPTKAATLAFHTHGYGGPQFRLDPNGSKVLYLESANANSARVASAYGGGVNSYFTRLHVDGELSTLGRIGVGITNPSTHLDIAGQVQISGVNQASPPAGLAYGLWAQNNRGLGLYSAATEANQGLGIWTNKNGNTPTEALTILRDGNVGIGTTSPIVKLHVNEEIAAIGSAYPSLFVMNTSKTDGVYGKTWGWMNYGGGFHLNGYPATNSAIAPGGPITAMSIQDTTGYVGIGKAIPIAALDIKGGPLMGGGWNRTLRLEAPHPAIQLKGTSQENKSAWIEYDDATSTNSLSFRIGGTNDDVTTAIRAMSIISSGNVGIGTVAPSQKLHVVGDARIQGSVTDCYIGNGSGGTSCSSDERLKENIKPIPYALEKINSLRGVEFEWNALSKSFGRKDIGVIAQDVEKVFPTAVVTGDDGYKKVDYAVLVAPLIQAVKELYNLVLSEKVNNVKQDRQIASLAESKADRAELEVLKAENIELKKKALEFDTLKAYLCRKDPEASICK